MSMFTRGNAALALVLSLVDLPVTPTAAKDPSSDEHFLRYMDGEHSSIRQERRDETSAVAVFRSQDGAQRDTTIALVDYEVLGLSDDFFQLDERERQQRLHDLLAEDTMALLDGVKETQISAREKLLFDGREYLHLEIDFSDIRYNTLFFATSIEWSALIGRVMADARQSLSTPTKLLDDTLDHCVWRGLGARIRMSPVSPRAPESWAER